MSKRFLLHASIALVVLSLLTWGTMKYLEVVTLHGQEIEVPDLQNLDKADLKEFLEEKNLRFKIMDSTYIGEEEKGKVVAQHPAPFSKVKKDRIIYVTINAMNPPSVRLPLLIDKSQRQAVSMIENAGLKVGELIYRPDQCVNCVLAQKLGNVEIQSDTVLKKGMVIDLVLGSGLSDEKVLVPFLIGLKRDAVLARLKESYLNIGAETYDEGSVYDDEDSASARVYIQRPEYGAKSWLPMGSPVDVEYTTMDTKIDTINVNFDSSLYLNIFHSEIKDSLQDTIQ